MSRTITSGGVTFMDLTDNRKLDVYITSNLPTTQIYDQNKKTYTPDWSVTNLQLSADVYLDSKDVTNNASVSVVWYKKNGVQSKTQVGTGTNLIISGNQMADSAGVITYVCEATYNDAAANPPAAHAEMTFTRVDTGLNGIDGTGVTILGSYNTVAELQSAHPTGNAGDAYIVNGNLYVWSIDKSQWTNVGNIQGPSGKDAKNILLSGESQVFKVSKTNVVTPATIKVTAKTFNTTVTDWTYSVNGGQTFLSTIPTGVSRNGDIVTINGTNITANSITIKASDGQVEDVLTIYKALDGYDGEAGNDGAPAPIAFLTNENISFSANAQGQISSTSLTSNIVAYNGTTKVLPTIGTITGIPTGMTITPSTITASNEIMLTITIANNATLGSTSSNMGTISIPVTSPVSTSLSLTWSKINTGATGATGSAGADSYTVFLTNEAHIFAGDVSNAVASTTSTQICAYKGTAAQSVTIATINGVAASTIDTNTGIAGLKFKCSAISGTTPTITFTCTTEFKNQNGTIPIVLSVGGITFTKIFTYSIAFKGATGSTGSTGPSGSSATSYWMVSSSSVIQKTSTGTIAVTPSSITLTGKSKTGINAPIDYACRWIVAYSTDGTNYTNLYTSASDEVSKSISVLTSYKTIRVRMYLSGGTTTLLDEQIIPIVSDGEKGNDGATGNGISSVTVTYGVSTSVSTQPTSWQTTIPTVAEGSYLWTRTVTDYTDSAMADTVTLTYAKQGEKGATGSAGTSVTVSKIEYQAGTSATTAPTGTWSSSVVSVAEGNYLWTKTTFSDNKVAYGVAKQGAKGDSGADAYTVILTNESHIFAGNVSSAIAASATTQVLAYKGSTSQSVTIVSVDGKTASTSSTATSITGLSFSCSALSGTSPTITFTCTTSFVSPNGAIPVVLTVGGVTITKMFTYGIAFKGSTGSQGATGTAASLVDITPSAHYFKSTAGKDGTFTPEYIYLYPRFQTVTYSAWQYSVNGGATWVSVSGANGLSVGTYNSVANTLRIARTSTLYTDTVTSISFRCVSSNSSVYDTVSIAKIYDVVDLEIGGRNLLKNTNILSSYTKDSPIASQLSFNIIDGYDLSNLIGKQIILSYFVSNLGDGVDNGTGATAGRFGMHGSIMWKNSTDGTTTVSYPFVTYLSTRGMNQRVSMQYTVTPPSGYDSITSISIACQPYAKPASTNDNVWTIGHPKLEIGNKATDWSPAPEDLNNITFQIHAKDGYLLTNELQSLELQTFAYEGSIAITSGVTFQWSNLINNVWTDIDGATGTTLTVAKADVLKAKSYRCVMTYKNKTYTDTVTVQDKTDTYDSVMCISSNATNNNCYWVLYTLVYSNAEEVDPLLGPISINAPTSPANGAYWYAIDETNATVTLKKYNGTSWANSTDTQALSYYWDIINDGSAQVPLGASSKVKVVSCNDFTATATLVCEVSNIESGLLTQSSLSLTDASDPIVSETEPTVTTNGQIWIKPNGNGTYLMFVWDSSLNNWISSDMDTRNKVYTSRPSAYNVGDLWITSSDTDHGSYLHGTLLQAQKSNTAYTAADWSPTLRYDKDIDDMKNTLNNLSQYVTITSAGLRIGARGSSGELSPFTSLFTSTELSFYQNSEKLLTLANNKLTAPRIEVEDDLVVQGSISLGDLQIIIESNGSFSFAVST